MKKTKRKKKTTSKKPLSIHSTETPVQCEACSYVGTRMNVPSNKHGWETQCRRCLAYYKH